jgi:hypothetical protein
MAFEQLNAALPSVSDPVEHGPDQTQWAVPEAFSPSSLPHPKQESLRAEPLGRDAQDVHPRPHRSAEHGVAAPHGLRWRTGLRPLLQNADVREPNLSRDGPEEVRPLSPCFDERYPSGSEYDGQGDPREARAAPEIHESSAPAQKRYASKRVEKMAFE